MDTKIPTATTKAKSGRALGVGGKLTGAISVIAGLTVVSIGIAIYAFQDARNEFRTFNEVQIPQVISAGELATFSTDVTIASSQLINAREEADRLSAFQSLEASVSQLIASAETQGSAADASPAIAALGERARAFQGSLAELDTLTRENIVLQAEGAERMSALFALHDSLAATLSPLVDDAYYSLIFDGESAAVEAGEVIDNILSQDVQTFRRLLTLRIETSATAAATSGYLMTEDDAIARTFDDRMIAASDRLRLLTQQLTEVDALPPIAAELALLADMPATARTMRRDPIYYAASPASRRFLSQLIDVEQAIDLALIDAVDDRIFDLTMNGEKAVANSTATITNLVDNQVTRLRDTLQMISTLREYTALIVQGALTSDATAIKTLQDRATGIVWDFENKVRAAESEEAASQIDALAAFADRETGLIALRGRQLGINDQVAAIVDTVFADTVEMNNLIGDVVDARRNAIAADSAVLESRLQQNGYLLIGLGAAVLVLTVLIGLLIINRGVAKPLTTLIDTTRALAEGRHDVAIGHAGRRDELGDLSRALAVFRENAIEKERMEAEAEGTRAEREEARAARERAKAEDARLIQIAVDALGEGLDHLSNGNVSFRIDEPFVESLESLRRNFNASLEKLSDTLASVKENADSIRNSSNEMRAGTDDLSRRTEQQAASLEETAAALDEITSTVKSSTRQAEHASQLVGTAKNSAEVSRTVVVDAISAMGRIEAASGQIAQIITVIDEIAFQTNLLALNAGVEAARAGEAGRGFAVVAQEVRELAGRAGKAAKEIKDLIQKSTSEVGAGVKLVRATGDALMEIEKQVIDINESVRAIATAAREQAVGLQEINTAVNHMDQMTQQNAAMVEETTAATHTLAQEADALRALIGQFRIGGSYQERRYAA